MQIIKKFLMIVFGFILAACTLSGTEPARTIISGQVLDQAEHPVAGAIVRVQASSIAATTGRNGYFKLVDPPAGGPVILTAFAPGYYILEAMVESGQSNTVFKLQAHPIEDNPDYEWLPSGDCAECHATDRDSPDENMPFDEWQQDAHSQAAVNPRFLSMYNGADLHGRQSLPTNYVTQRDYGRLPLKADPNQPNYGPGYKLDFPNSAGNCAACHLPAAAVNAPYGVDPNTVTGVGLEGIPCDLCHKVWAVKLDPITGRPRPNMPGVLSFEFCRPPDEEHQLFIGPFDDVAPGEDTFSPLQNQSEFCAPCHFGVFWDIPIYNSFGEWLDSPYADPESGLLQTCQDCHMPRLGVDHFARFKAGGLARPSETIFSHRMPGASDQALLQNTAELQLTTKRNGDLIQVTATVTNTGAGHHIPTDSPLRQIFLVVKATDAQGQILPLQNGPTLPNWTGNLAGQPGVYFAKILAQLWTEITPTAAYWMPTRLVEDTRLPALATDISHYIFVAPSSSEITVEAELVFRRAYYELRQQKSWDTPDIIMESVTELGSHPSNE